MNNCQVEKIHDVLYRCKVCKFTSPIDFDQECRSVQPHKCIHTGDKIEDIDTKHCNCAGRGSNVSIHKCNLYNTDCGLLKLLHYNKKKELLDKGIRDCMDCHNRFDKQNP